MPSTHEACVLARGLWNGGYGFVKIFRKPSLLSVAWLTFGINTLVILQGAYVRASGSGDGCGRHWPLCHGSLVPINPTLEALVEFSHRSLSTLALLACLWLFLRALPLRRDQPGLATFATLAFILVIIEALLGAATVLFGLTGDNVTVARGIMVSAHLVNSMLLVGAIAGAIVYARPHPPRWPLAVSRQPELVSAFVLGLVLMLVLMFSGGIAAMGTTMFPSESLVEGIAADFAEDAHPLVRLRILHPLLGVVVGIFLFIALGFARFRKPVSQASSLASSLFVVYVLQGLAGAVNLALLGPMTLKLLHLGLAVASFALFTAVALATLGYPLERRAESGAAPAPMESPLP